MTESFFGTVVRNVSPVFLWQLTDYVYAILRHFRQIVIAKVTFAFICSKSTIEIQEKGVKHFKS